MVEKLVVVRRVFGHQHDLLDGTDAVVVDLPVLLPEILRLVLLAGEEAGARRMLRLGKGEREGNAAGLAIRRHRDVGVSGAEEPVLVRGNKDAIHQAVRNLVENALRFAPEGTEVEIAVDPAGSVSVSDHGPGVPPGERDMLFRRFWQGERKKRDGGGAGLGLAIAQRIAETHGARLEVADNPGGGARFTLSLPVVA